MNAITRYVAVFLIAAVATGVIASIVQTQIILGPLVEFGAPVTAAVRAWTTLEDLARFGPVMIGIAATALLPAVLLAHVVSRVLPAAWRTWVFALAAVVGLWGAFWLMRSVIPMPAIPGTRGPAGHLLMSLTGLAGGLAHAWLTSPARRSKHAEDPRPWRHAVTAAILVAVPALLFVAMAPGAGDKLDPVDPASYTVQTVKTGLNRPWSIAFLPDGRALVTEMGGRLLAIGSDGTSSDIALDALPPVFQQGGVIGLMEVALDPQFAQNGWLYLTMGYGSPGANGTRLVRARLAGDRIEDVHVLFESTPKPRAGNNGGRLAFLGDGTLVLSLGDGSARREEAQSLENHLGTVLRLDRDGRPPADNPFVRQRGAAPEIYSFGHRNAQGIAVDPATGDLLVSEHGARGGDEINRIVPGGNYGWPVVTGGIDYPFARVTPFRQLPGYEDAVLEWTPSIAPAGLAIYDGTLFPEWRGDLLVPALKERAVRRVLREGRRIVGQQLLLADLNERMRDVKVAPDGSVHVLTDGVDARLLRLTPRLTPPE
ncbi:PQQ-dependent oxidoreductase, gdhB family [plant metagenome]|uniref:PQQ-dependent oxidoreductase, gdhB family n=1 Tax=plant metagenome TaxID=1297885 RepID=A0A484UQ05_9ZZZZ